MATLLLLVCAVAQVTVSSTQVVEQANLAERLLSTDRVVLQQAAREAAAIAPDRAGSALKDAMILALYREAEKHNLRSRAIRRGVMPEDNIDPEFIYELLRPVIALEDPRSINSLAAALGTGSRTIRALASFGERAILPIVRVMRGPDVSADVVADGLIALRFIVETTSLSRQGLANLEAATRFFLSDAAPRDESGVPLQCAIDLAGVIPGNPLKEVLQMLATDPAEVIGRGVSEVDRVNRIQQTANERLAGVLPLPRP